MSNHDMGVKEIGEVLDMVSTKLPGLIKQIYDTLFSEEGATSMSKAVGIFYKNLLEAGMDREDAMRLTQEYMSTLKSMLSQVQQPSDQTSQNWSWHAPGKQE